MKKNILIRIGIGIIIIIGGWIIFFNVAKQSVVQEGAGDSYNQEILKKEVVLVIDNGEAEPKPFKIEFKEGTTAFDLLKNKADESSIALETKIYDIGIFIEAIEDKKNGQDGKYWIYYVNGEMPMVSADKKEIKAGDKVEFKFEKSPF